jgi:hypothetical protein
LGHSIPSLPINFFLSNRRQKFRANRESSDKNVSSFSPIIGSFYSEKKRKMKFLTRPIRNQEAIIAQKAALLSKGEREGLGELAANSAKKGERQQMMDVL